MIHQPKIEKPDYWKNLWILNEFIKLISSNFYFYLINANAVLTRRQSEAKQFGGLTARERTVENHVGNILTKLGFDSRAQIAVWAVERGLGKEENQSS